LEAVQATQTTLDDALNQLDYVLEQSSTIEQSEQHLSLVAPDTDDPDYTSSLPDNYPIPLRPYQEDGAAFLRMSKRAFCTYQPGLGKTETAIAACLPPEYQWTSPDSVTRREYTTYITTDESDEAYLAHSSKRKFTKVYSPNTYREWRPVIKDPITNEYRLAKVVICAPSYLTDMWFDRILEYIPTARVVLAQGTRQARERTLKLDADWYIINYEMLHARTFTEAQQRARNLGQRKHKDSEPYPIPEADYYIFDESHHLKNHQGKQSQAAAELVHPYMPIGEPQTTWRTPNVYLLSGTPIKREPDDLFMQLHIMYPHTETNALHPDYYFRSYNDFVRYYCSYLPSPYGPVVMGAKGSANARKTNTLTPVERLMGDVAHYISYEEAGIYRPEVQPSTISITLDPDYQKAYDEIASMYAYKDLRMYSAIEVIHALRTVTACPAKVKAAVNLAEQFSRNTDGKGGCMFFTHYVQSAKLLSQQLTKATGIPTPFIAGSQVTTRNERTNTLQSQPTYLVGTLGSLSQGVNNLTYMKAVVFFESSWTPDEIEQAIDRVRRFGNESEKIFVYYLLGRKTIDEQIHAVVGKRGITAEMIIRRTLQKWKRLHKGGDE